MSTTSISPDNPSYLALSSEDAFAYSQPPLTLLLILLSFLYLLNVVRVGADYFLHAGVVAMIALGTIYGTPLAAILPQDWESTFTSMGYLGLVGIVFEGMPRDSKDDRHLHDIPNCCIHQVVYRQILPYFYPTFRFLYSLPQ